MKKVAAKFRNNLKVVYIAILLLIGILIALLIYLLSDQISIPTLNSRYDKLYAQAVSSNERLISLQNRIETVKAKLESSSTPQEDQEIYNELLSVYLESKDELLNRIELNQSLNKLNLNEELNKQTEDSINADRASLRLLEREINFIEKQKVRIGYELIALQVNSCFTAIDYNQQNNTVINSIQQCLDKFQQQRNYFSNADLNNLGLESDFSATKAYHTAFEQRWQKSIEVYKALEARDISRSNILKSELDLMISQLGVLKVQSETELNSVLK